VASAPDVAFLRTVLLFKDVAESDLRALWPWLKERRLRKGEALFREGDPGNEMYFIRSGTVVISKLVTGRVEQVLRRMEPGDFFGEMSLFDQLPRSATVQAETAASLLSLNGADLERLTELSPRASTAFFYQMVQVFIRRLRDTSELVSEVTRWGLESTGLDVGQSS
jgi:CRP/FNR family transcriptional regulator